MVSILSVFSAQIQYYWIDYADTVHLIMKNASIFLLKKKDCLLLTTTSSLFYLTATNVNIVCYLQANKQKSDDTLN